jgi:N-methylhydantoinase A
MRYLSADVGGTFTDLVLIDSESGALHFDKLPSTPDSAEAVTEGIRRITAAAGVDRGACDLFVHGFTIATNALLTRSGARLAMVVTEGFRDILEIGEQVRPHLYRLDQTRPPPVVPRSRIVEVSERIDAFGAVVQPLDEDEAARAARAVAALEPEAVAVCLAFGHLYPDHEAMVEAALRECLPGIPIYLGSRVNPQIEEYPRSNTTAVAAYVGPIIDRYLDRLEAGLEDLGATAPLRLMRSDGGVATPGAARHNPAHMLLSGPAGGVIAGAHLARALDVPNLISFDMGGTSADFSLIVDSEPRRSQSRVIDGQPLRLSTLDIETISAGGGSIARVDVGGALRVGPDSAGAEPGPACYGKGGEQATVTDAAVVLGILDPDEYLGGEMAIDAGLARAAIERTVAKPLGLGVEEAAFGVITVANAGMIQAIRTLSVERGHDVRRFSLLAFGGAGPIYASYMARDLGMAEVLVPQNPGVYAALGLLQTDIRHTAQAPYQRTFSEVDADDLAARLTGLKAGLDEALARDGVAPADRWFRHAADLRCVGQFHELHAPLPAPDGDGWWDAEARGAEFHRLHEIAYGHADASVPVEFVNLRLEAFGRMPRAELPELAGAAGSAPEPTATRRVYLDRETGAVECPIFRRADLKAGHLIEGPAIVIQRDSTTVVLSEQEAEVTALGVIRIRPMDKEEAR